MWARLEGDKQLDIHFPSWIDFRCLRNHRRWMFCTFCCSNHNTIFWTDRHMARYLAWHCKHPEKEFMAVLSTRRDNIQIWFWFKVMKYLVLKCPALPFALLQSLKSICVAVRPVIEKSRALTLFIIEIPIGEFRVASPCNGQKAISQ